MPMISGFIAITPEPKRRARTYWSHDKMRTRTPQKTRDYEDNLRQELWILAKNKEWKSTLDYCELHLYLFMKRPISDADNLSKSFMDAAQEILYENDRQVWAPLPYRIKAPIDGIYFKMTTLDKTQYEKVCTTIYTDFLNERLHQDPYSDSGNPIDIAFEDTEAFSTN